MKQRPTHMWTMNDSTLNSEYQMRDSTNKKKIISLKCEKWNRVHERGIRNEIIWCQIESNSEFKTSEQKKGWIQIENETKRKNFFYENICCCSVALNAIAIQFWKKFCDLQITNSGNAHHSLFTLYSISIKDWVFFKRKWRRMRSSQF